MNVWRDTITAPEGIAIKTKIDDDDYGPRNEAILKRQGQLWFYPDMSTYVYYTPTHWMPLTSPVAPQDAPNADSGTTERGQGRTTRD